ncbi:pyruvate kinase, partial [Pelomicrobium sp. G1]
GPKIRIGKFERGKGTLVPGQTFILDAECKRGNEERVGLDYNELPNDVSKCSILLFYSFLIFLSFDGVTVTEIYTRVIA